MLMTPQSSLKRWLAGGLAVLVVGAVVALSGLLNGPAAPGAVGAGAPKGGALNWTMFGGDATRNMVNTKAKGIASEWDTDAGVNIKWSADLGSKAYGGPIVAGGVVLMGTNNQNPRDKKHLDAKGKPIDMGVVMAFNEADGKFLWQNAYDKLKAGRVVDWPLEGICSNPVVEGPKTYYVSNRCEVVCADLATGKHIWTLDMIGKLGVFPHNLSVCSPLLVGDHLWIVTANSVDEGHINVPAPKAPSFIKVDKRNGEVLWQDNTPTINLTKVPAGGDNKDFLKKLVNSGELIQHGQWSNPAYAVVQGQPQVVFPGGNGWIYSFDPDGKLLWKFDCNPKDSIYELSGRGTRNDFIATPVIYKDRVYIGVGQDPEHETGVGHLWCIDMTKRGDVSPELVVDNTVFPPKTKKNPESAAVWHYGGSITDPAERRKLGRNNYFGRTMSTVAIHEGILYASELLGWMHCLDADTGKVHWTHNAEDAVWSSPTYIDGKVFLGTDAGKVYVFEHGKTKKILSTVEMDGRIRATPVAANGVLYVVTDNRIYAVAPGAGKKKE
jgi:outer membrane protein assembly factor BamB